MEITSATVMNSFYIPEMAGMIYAMAGMQTELNAVINQPGVFKGFSANYSGNGFSHMRFDFVATDEAGFEEWVAKVQSAPMVLDQTSYTELQSPSKAHPVTYFGETEEGIWDKILNMCAGTDELCLNDMKMVDALGGGGLDGLYNRELYRGLCSADDPQSLFLLLKPEAKALKGDILSALTYLTPEPLPHSQPQGTN